MTSIEKIFEKASQRTITTSIPIITTLCLGILLIVLSATQTAVILDDSLDDFGDSTIEFAEDIWKEICTSDVIQYLSPFHYEFEGFVAGCPWRVRNTVFRLLLVSIMIITNGFALFVLFSSKFEKIWPVIYWLNWIIFIMMFVVFVLDCDGLNTGYSSCKDDFTFDGESEFLVDKCYLTPFIWTPIVDLLISLVVFCCYKISKYYIFDENVRKQSIVNSKKTDTFTPNDGGVDTGGDGGVGTTTATQPPVSTNDNNDNMMRSAYDEY